MRTPGKLRKLLQLSSNDRRMLVSAFWMLAAFRFGLVLFSFDKIRGFLTKLLPDKLDPIEEFIFRNQQIISRVVWAVNASNRYLPISTNCFPRALATHVLLRRRSIPSEIQIGVAHSVEGTLEAHAWVEYQGQIVIGKVENLERFVPLPRLNEKLA
jgi:hypothetical protein